MTVTLTLRPEVEAGLLAKARAGGTSLERYVQSVVEKAAALDGESTAAGLSARDEAVKRMLEFGDKYHLGLGEPVTRELLREGHRY